MRCFCVNAKKSWLNLKENNVRKLFLLFCAIAVLMQKSRTEVRDFCLHLFCQCKLVEAGRVELPSESTSTGTSPSADDHLHSLTQA